MNKQESDFFCNLTVLIQQERDQFTSLTDCLFAAVQETRELDQIKSLERE